MAVYPPLTELDARRVALIKPSALGDIIHALPVLTALRQRFPAAHISWIVNRTYAPLLEGHPHLDATLPFDRAAWQRGAWEGTAAFLQFLRQLRSQCFDLVIDLQGLLRTGLMVAATRAARRVGLATAREGAAWFCTDVIPVPDSERLHAVDRYWLVAQALGAREGPRTFRLPQRERERHWAETLLRPYPRPWVALAPGARWRTKRWRPEHFATLARRGQQSAGGTVIFVGGAEDSTLAAQVARDLSGPVLDLTGRTTLPQLTALLGKADWMLANDTGPLHLAAALGRPVLAPYTCTRACLTGPYGQPTGAVETRVVCQGSLLKQCRQMDCMAELTPDRLWPRLHEMMQSWLRHRHSA